MTIIHEQIDVKIKKITSFLQEKNLFGNMYVQGICEANLEEEDSFEFNFNYKGKPNENKNKIMNYLKSKAEQIYIDKRKQECNTLSDLVNEFINYDE